MTRLDQLHQMSAVGSDECISWPYGKNDKGYGYVWDGSRQRRTHVLVCELFHGERPAGHEAAHGCGNRACVNPRHLRWATSSENKADIRLHGRQRTVLSADQVADIRQRSTSESGRQLAAEFGVAPSTVHRIVAGHKWKWLDPASPIDDAAQSA